MSHVYGRTFDEESGNELTDTECPECDGQISVDGGERTCAQCGLIVETQRIDHGPEWRTFGDDETNPSRVGAPRTPTRHDRGLSTNIGHEQDANGRPLSTAKRTRLHRQRREHRRARFDSKRERNEMYGHTEIRRLYGALGVPESTWERACTLFARAQDQDLFIGRSLDAFAAASVYAACRCAGLPRQIEAFEPHARCTLQKIRNAYRVLNTELGLETQLRSPADFVPKFASATNCSPTSRRVARTLADRIEDANLMAGVRPSGVAAACVYLGSQSHDTEPVTQTDIAAVAHVSSATIRKRRSAIREHFDIVAVCAV